MQRSRIALIFLSVAAAIAIGFIAGSRRQSENLNVQVVRTYMVPADRADEIKAQLNGLFYGWKDGEPTGRAQVFSNGLLLVRAPVGFHTGIHNFIEQLGSTSSPIRSAIHIDYWLVTGNEDKESNSESIPLLSPVLSAITKLDGPRKFHILEHLSTNSMAGQEVEIKGSISEAKSVAVAGVDFVNLRLEYKSKLGSIKTDTQAKAGEFLILGQNLVEPNSPLRSVIKSDSANVYYIVRADLAK